MEVEREVIDLYRAFFMRDRVGDQFDGTISGVAGFGVFVVVDDPFVEGLVRVDALSDDFYIFDEASCRLVGRRSSRTFALGDTVRVEVQSVSVVRRKIDFALADQVARNRGRELRPGGRRRRGGGADRPGATGRSGSGAGAGARDRRPGRDARGNSRAGKPKKKGR